MSSEAPVSDASARSRSSPANATPSPPCLRVITASAGCPIPATNARSARARRGGVPRQRADEGRSGSTVRLTGPPDGSQYQPERHAVQDQTAKTQGKIGLDVR